MTDNEKLIAEARELCEKCLTGVNKHHGYIVTKSSKYGEDVYEAIIERLYNFEYKIIPALADALEKAEQGERWIPVSERLPKDKQYCLVFISNHYGSCISTRTFYKKFNGNGGEGNKPYKNTFWDYDSEYGYYPVRDVTHWRPLPEPPKEDK